MVSGRSWLHLPACSGGIIFQPPIAEVRRSRRLFGWPSVYHTNLARQSACPAPDRDYQILRAANPWPHPNVDRKSTRLKLQSPCNLVCRLLLEKKKKKK